MAKLLLIEDERILRENTCELLEAYGYDCVTAEHGKDGLKAAIRETPDLIICDIMLPYLDGYQIKAELNKLENYGQIPFIYLSAKIERSDLRKGMDLGAADYITKPFKIAELVNSIESRIAQKKNIQETVVTKVIESISDFIHIAKHECNTPLHAIINLSDLIQNQQPSPSNFADMAVKAINTSGKRLHKTLNNLIDLVRLRHYNASNESAETSTDIKGVTQKLLADRADYYNFNKTIHTTLDGEWQVGILAEDLEIIVFELLDNIFKFSDSSSIPEVALNTVNINAQNYVSLTTINSVTTPILFSQSDIGPFKQYNRAETEQQGSGLGLYLIQLITEKHNGTISIDCSQPQLFSVTVTLPIHQTP